MADLLQALPPELRNQVAAVGEQVNPGELESFERVTRARDQSYKLQTLVTAWKQQHEAERSLRQKVAWCILGALAFQILLVNTCFFLIGFNVLHVDADLSKIFVLAVFAEIVSMVLIVLRYLFPQVGTEFLQLIKEL
ncbi:hypothetical protein [Hymenobacter chitinivorans]|uniref:Superfamily III holin-X n=1 Tax=Hymenobacter chitinivorans DSM 11115 TaxID=1121954 RepID=A0A2M9BKY3_9BACT|nr:hypothetical protein [Hymenobacter chitinivorans]PJJ58608.1 hypothetical protein CLV45_0018 [Hymenobacter chitinivorans DSM 11115]